MRDTCEASSKGQASKQWAKGLKGPLILSWDYEVSQDEAPQLYQIGSSPDVTINGMFEGHTEPRLTSLSWLFMGRRAKHAATSSFDVNTDLARGTLLAKHLQLLLLELGHFPSAFERLCNSWYFFTLMQLCAVCLSLQTLVWLYLFLLISAWLWLGNDKKHDSVCWLDNKDTAP